MPDCPHLPAFGGIKPRPATDLFQASGGGQVSDRMLLQLGQVGADQGINGVEARGAVLGHAVTDSARGPFADGLLPRAARDVADALTVEVDVDGDGAVVVPGVGVRFLRFGCGTRRACSSGRESPASGSVQAWALCVRRRPSYSPAGLLAGGVRLLRDGTGRFRWFALLPTWPLGRRGLRP